MFGASLTLVVECQIMVLDCYYFMVGLINCSLTLQAITTPHVEKKWYIECSHMERPAYSLSGSQQNVWHRAFVASIWCSWISYHKDCFLDIMHCKNVMVIHFGHGSAQHDFSCSKQYHCKKGLGYFNHILVNSVAFLLCL